MHHQSGIKLALQLPVLLYWRQADDSERGCRPAREWALMLPLPPPPDRRAAAGCTLPGCCGMQASPTAYI